MVEQSLVVVQSSVVGHWQKPDCCAQPDALIDMAKKRTALEQVKSGFRIAGTMVLAFFFLVALWASVRFLTLRNNIENKGAHPLLGGLSLLLLSGTLLFTTKSWSRWLFAILAYSAAKLFFGGSFFAFGAKPRVDLETGAVTVLILVLSTLATAKFVKRAPLGAERPGLVAFLVCLIFAIEYQSWTPWVVGLALLAAGHAIHFFMHTRKYLRPKHSMPA